MAKVSIVGYLMCYRGIRVHFFRIPVTVRVTKPVKEVGDGYGDETRFGYGNGKAKTRHT